MPTSISSQTVPMGLVVDTEQMLYPMELSSTEIYVHLGALNEYKNDFIVDLVKQSRHGRPSTKLINQQPKMPPQRTRHGMVTFLYQLSLACNVTSGVFANAVRLYDRYSSKRIVLVDQSKLVAATCLWLSAKSMGGCDHVINDHAVPTGGRFHGPTPRARLPRLNELIFYCGGKKHFSKSMFIQMERHILHTLNWDVSRPTLNDLVLNIDENCLIQYESYKKALLPRKNDYRKELTQIDNKIELIDIKMFLVNLVAWQYDLLDYEMHEVSNAIFRLLTKCLEQDCPNFIQFPLESNVDSMAARDKIDKILVNAVCNAPACLLTSYNKSSYVRTFCSTVKDMQNELSSLVISTPLVPPPRRGSLGIQKFMSLEKVPSYNLSDYSSPASSTAMTFSEINLNDDDDDDDSETTSDESDTSTSRRESTSQSATSVFSAHGASRNSTPLSGVPSKYPTHQNSPLAGKSKMSQTVAMHSVYLSNDYLQSKVSL